MTYIKNNKVLVLVIAVLLLSNIAMLYFYLNRCKPKDPPKKNLSMREMMVQKLKNEVGFNDQQVESYKQMSDKHKQAMKPMFEQLRLSKDSLYKMLMQDKPSDSLINYHLVKIGEKQKAIDQRIFSHFYALKQVCTPEQMPKYDSTMQKVIKGMIKGHK
jgi:periplasmic protein CpxP/Spy